MTQIHRHLCYLTIALRVKRRQWANLGSRQVTEWKYVEATELQVYIGTRTRGVPHGRPAARMKNHETEEDTDTVNDEEYDLEGSDSSFFI